MVGCRSSTLFPRLVAEGKRLSLTGGLAELLDGIGGAGGGEGKGLVRYMPSFSGAKEASIPSREWA